MTSLTQSIILAGLALTVALPSFAGDMTKGTKTYQTPRTAQSDQPAAKEADPAKIEPAAGDQAPAAEAKPAEGKSFKEEMRLPRKN